MTTRLAVRVATVLATLLAPTALAAPALAAQPDDGAEPGPGLTVAETLLIFLGAPLALFALITLLVLAPSIARGGYRPSLGWWSEPVWFGGPADPYGALDAVAQGGTPAPATTAGGGTGARW